MAFPSVVPADTQTGSVTSNSNSWTDVTYPTNLQSGDLILCFMAIDGNPTASFPAGWVVRTLSSTNTTVAGVIAKKKSDGTESGTFTVSLTASEQGVWRTVRIINWEGTLGTNFDNDANAGAVVADGVESGATFNPTCPNLNPNNWATEDTLWIAFSSDDHGNTTYTGFPTNYTQEDHTTAGGHSQESGGAGGAAMGLAYRQLAASSEDPGDFTVDAAEGYEDTTIAIRPAAPAAFVPRNEAINHTSTALLMRGLRRAWHRRRSGIFVPDLWLPEGV